MQNLCVKNDTCNHNDTLSLGLERRHGQGAKVKLDSYNKGGNVLGIEGTTVDLRSRAKPAPDAGACVVVIDDDAEFRESLGRLLRSVDLQPRLFASIADFLSSELPDAPTCLVLDVRLPGRSGLDFQRDLAEASIDLPIIFITGYGDIPMTVQAMKGGAIEFLTKPFRDQDLLDAVNVGLARDSSRRENEESLSALRARFEVLTPREREILFQIVEGRLNKQIASDMGVTETTIKVHRSNLMRKIKAPSFAELCRMVDRLKVSAKGKDDGR
ncbi:FixJ family two-component response regulator [Povalibacter uvarum]|uniref:FixJ family two-component response regulator n=1 Tax=Povalibacter uvarum TaxID=732238 RepID=A0A841HS67_9GAMM|nr:response regulator transcription factor [Povalibacter uvarum]MBB6095613.1 FixJ family two-component response regulator [Povalibacter uvarum]